jgi:HAD superfamily hydrolase (TIGR01509 family)
LAGCFTEVVGLKIRAVVVDLDGTITRFNLDFMAFRRRALQELERMNLRTPDMTDQVGFAILLSRVKARVDRATFRELRERIYPMIEEMELKAAPEVALYPGAVETLRKLRASSIKIGLVTNNGRRGTNITLSRYGLLDLFDAIITRDDCEDMKPDPEPVSKVLGKLDVMPDEAILVGDGVMDIMAAKAAGVLCAAVATGPFKSDLLLSAEPDYALGSINDLPTLVQLLNQS